MLIHILLQQGIIASCEASCIVESRQQRRLVDLCGQW